MHLHIPRKRLKFKSVLPPSSTQSCSALKLWTCCSKQFLSRKHATVELIGWRKIWRPLICLLGKLWQLEIALFRLSNFGENWGSNHWRSMSPTLVIKYDKTWSNLQGSSPNTCPALNGMCHLVGARHGGHHCQGIHIARCLGGTLFHICPYRVKFHKIDAPLDNEDTTPTTHFEPYSCLLIMAGHTHAYYVYIMIGLMETAMDIYIYVCIYQYRYIHIYMFYKYIYIYICIYVCFMYLKADASWICGIRVFSSFPEATVPRIYFFERHAFN